MPPEVFFVLAWSGLSLVASLAFFVSEDVALLEVRDPRLDVAFCVPPVQLRARPPPLPHPRVGASARIISPVFSCAVPVFTRLLAGSMTLRPMGEVWEVTLDTAPVPDMPAFSLANGRPVGSVSDLRWNRRAGMGRPLRSVWKQRPGRA